MKRVTVYTTDFCGYCTSAKTLLNRRGIEFEEINLARDSDAREQLAKISGMWTFPQILIDDEPIGGFQELLAADRAGRLKSLAAA
jgi:glutaredoxin 3